MTKVIFCMFAGLVFALNTCQADLLVNGSFEDSGSFAADWSPSGNLQVISTQGETDGTQAVAFSFANLPSNGSISQSFATDIGQIYTLTFDFGKYSINQPTQSAILVGEVFDGTGFGGTQLLDETVVDSTPGSGDPNSTDSPDVYESFSFNFVAQSATSTLRFTDQSDAQGAGGGFDAMLDNVAITAIPEPSSLMALGFALALSVSRQRR